MIDYLFLYVFRGLANPEIEYRSTVINQNQGGYNAQIKRLKVNPENCFHIELILLYVALG
ncbi:MAG: hypothetical protein V7641_3990 [Blastocatellia bacterium]